MIPHLAHGLLEQGRGVTPLQRWVRELAGAWPFEGVAAGLDDALEVAGFARKAAGVLELVVIRLQLVVGHGPVLDGRILWDGPFPVAGNGAASDLEIPGGMPPGPASPVKARAAKPLAPGKRPMPPHGPGNLTRAIAERNGRAREVFKELQ